MTTPNISPHPVRRHWGGADALVAQVAAELGCSKARAGQLLWGELNAARTVARIVRALQRAGADEQLVKFMQPIDEALITAAPAELVPDLFLLEQEADGAEDTAETAYLARPCRDTAESFLRRARKATAELGRLCRSVAARWGIA